VSSLNALIALTYSLNLLVRLTDRLHVVITVNNSDAGGGEHNNDDGQFQFNTLIGSSLE